jgi:hypothetical protein
MGNKVPRITEDYRAHLKDQVSGMGLEVQVQVWETGFDSRYVHPRYDIMFVTIL